MTSEANSNDHLMTEQCYAGKLPSNFAISICYFNTIHLNIIADQVHPLIATSLSTPMCVHQQIILRQKNSIITLHVVHAVLTSQKSLLANTNKVRNTNYHYDRFLVLNLRSQKLQLLLVGMLDCCQK